MNKITLKIPNISCGHCVNAIKNELLDMKGIKSAEGDPSQKTMDIEFIEPATEADILKVLKEINYPAQ
ncbi:heavy-metal-associated domain-containing protein [Desulforegula conservatrix]|uniref:heavy-metal-associated domain-containing protein n=1 Tax=Desulforegula conservatrix TaxID=153026 RepID=UPI00041F59D5|nr:heavy-metal-associated domain-containing protein [Desulforegula conservatrix]